MKHRIFAALCAWLLLQPAFADSSGEGGMCDRLVTLYIELGERSGQTVTKAQARAVVLSESPSEAECAAMLALFEAQK